jgi:hypothetical protein
MCVFMIARSACVELGWGEVRCVKRTSLIGVEVEVDCWAVWLPEVGS